MSTKTNHLAPAKAIHPGEILKDELEAREISQKDFATKLGIQPTQLNEIIKGKRGINTEHAVLIGKGLGMDPTIWQNLQSLYELDLVKINERTQDRLVALDQWEMIKDLIPEKYLKKMGAINGDPINDIPVIKDIYQINKFEELPGLYNQPAFYHNRKSDKLPVDKINLLGWVNLLKSISANTKVDRFDHKNELEIIKGLKKIISKNDQTIINCKKFLAEFGIKLNVLKHPEKCAVDGVSFWSNGNPAIGLSIRYNRIDNFAFTLFHELGHVFCHLVNNNTAEFIDVDINKDSSSKEELENEADVYANNMLINKNNWDRFFSLSTRLQKNSIIEFSKSEVVHPAIVKGRLCYELKSYSIKVDIDDKIY